MEAEIRIIKVEDEIAGVLKGKPMTFDEADSGNVNPHFERGTPTDENCQTCVVCFKARLDGFDVMAKPFDNKNTIMCALSENTSLAWIDINTGIFPKYMQPKENYMPRLLSWFNKNIEKKKYYTIEFYWKGAIDGHIMLIYIKDEKIVLYDPQSNDFFSDKDLEQILYTIRRNTIKLINISDCFLNKSVVDYVLEARK